MKTVYTNISPVTNAYTNFNHVYYLKRIKPKKVYLCVWDNFVFESPVFHESLHIKTTKIQKLHENVEALEKLMSHLNMDFKTIYLSEAWSRLFQNSNFSALFQKILSEINLENLKDGFDLEYIPFKEITISRLNYIIVDYLIATYLPELFPEICSTHPTHYLTSERFKVFHKMISSHLETVYQKCKPPEPIYVKNVPVIMYKGVIPSMEMPKEKIQKIVTDHYRDRPSKKELFDILTVLNPVLKTDISLLVERLNKKNKEKILCFLTESIYSYFRTLQKTIQKENAKERMKSLFISKSDEFEKLVKPLNSLKLRILQHCDGGNTSLDVSRKTSLKLSTVSTYFDHLKKQGLITNERKPQRLVDSIVIDLKNIKGAQ